MAPRVIPVDPFDLVIFGGTGDLARRKILPGLYRRFQGGQMTDAGRIIGAARADLTDEGFRAFVREAVEEFVPPSRRDEPSLAAFLTHVGYVAIDAKGDAGWPELKARMRGGVVQAFYFSVSPTLFGDLAERLHAHGIADGQ